MAMAVMTCRSCGASLTARVRKTDSSELRRHVGGQRPTVPSGVFFINERPVTVDVWYPKERRRETVEHFPPGSYVLNPDDRIPGALAPVPGRDGGCCGLDGTDGPNQQCACGAIVGTAWTDCWTQYELRLLSDRVDVR